MKKAYAEMMTELDRGVGEIMAALQRHDLEKDTLVFFFSDNGATGPGSNGNLRGKKGSLWEGGHRVPAIARWPCKVPAGAVCDQTAMGMDLMPTMLELAGVPTPASHVLDGMSLRRVLLDGRDLPEHDLFWRFGQRKAMRRGPWKLGVGEPELGEKLEQHIALFNVADDPSETIDLASIESGIANQKLESLQQWDKAIDVNATQQPDRTDVE